MDSTLAPFEDGHSLLRDFKLTSFRYMAHPPQRFVPRALRKLAVARDSPVYEGFRRSSIILRHCEFS